MRKDATAANASGSASGLMTPQMRLENLHQTSQSAVLLPLAALQMQGFEETLAQPIHSTS